MKKNVLFIFSDQHSKEKTGCYGNAVIKTPNIDSLAENGVRFDNAYCNSPLCVPSRASLATGRYIHEIGAWDNASPYTGEQRSWGHRFLEEGFSVTTIGKLHFRNETDDTGFPDQRIPLHCRDGIGDLYGVLRDKKAIKRSLGDDARKAGLGKSKYIDYDRKVASLAQEYLLNEATKKDDPWFLYVGFVTPHFPLQVPEEYLNLYNPEDIILPKCYGLEERPDHPAWEDVRRYMCSEDEIDDAQLREAVRAYYGLCSFMDEQVGNVVNALKESGMYDDTIIVYSTDHGEMLGDHGLWLKNCLLEGSVSIPLIVSGSDIPNGKVVKTNVSLIDTYQTLLDAAGIELNEEDMALPGTSLMPLINGDQEDHNRMVFAEYTGSGSTTAGFMLRDGRYKYINYLGYPPLLFDLEMDPDERVNLADDPSIDINEYEKKLREFVNPELVDQQSREDQERLLNKHGGREHVRNSGNEIVASPPPAF